MAEIIKLNTHTDYRGSLTFVDKEIPFQIKSTEYLYGNKGENKVFLDTNPLAIICLKGKTAISLISTEKIEESHLLNTPNHCLIYNTKGEKINLELLSESILLLLFS